MQIVAAEAKAGNTQELRKLKAYIQGRIAAVDDMALYDEQKAILTQTIPAFLQNKFPSEIREKMRYSSLCNAIGKAKHLEKGYVMVYDALGLDYETVSAYGFNGLKTWNLFESKLNEYGLSTSQRLSKSQINELKRISHQKSTNGYRL